ncbi:uncharacterized protein with alpha-helical domain and ER motif [Acinetobacter calcoaceticus]|uniref:Uncharacterized protein with alpha-helical domain and ER motif n=1 Tax=Acinetobacter calcoaceticus TaxID=471 RepID=A0A4R1XIM1_ACICA|nr:uncharacterized protein with alpha-helical domain and ER motif [Acinetobacter calcoaceticus]
MILLHSNAQNIFWLGRYLARIEYLCRHFPFKDHQLAQQYARGFVLDAEDADGLNTILLDSQQYCSFQQLFSCAKNNIHDLRGVLSAGSFAELNQLFYQAEHQAVYICDIAADCNAVLEAEESTDLFLFFSLGQQLEHLDRQIRLQQRHDQTLHDIDGLLLLLANFGWKTLAEDWALLQQNPDSTHFSHFSDCVQRFFDLDRL